MYLYQNNKIADLQSTDGIWTDRVKTALNDVKTILTTNRMSKPVSKRAIKC